MTCPDLPLTRGSVRAEALWDVHELSARTVQPAEISSGTLRDRVQKAIDWFWI
jgi:hypothetical protein